MGTEPVGEIRGGLHDELSHSDVGPKITNKNRNSHNRYNRFSKRSLATFRRLIELK